MNFDQIFKPQRVKLKNHHLEQKMYLKQQSMKSIIKTQQTYKNLDFSFINMEPNQYLQSNRSIKKFKYEWLRRPNTREEECKDQNGQDEILDHGWRDDEDVEGDVSRPMWRRRRLHKPILSPIKKIKKCDQLKFDDITQ